MKQNPLVSIIITSYNYGRFLRESIDSAINQTYANIEIIAVDDGSKDNSKEIITSYGNKITAILKDNGGQASAFNAGFKVSNGEVIVFLDSDDALIPTAIENVICLFNNQNIAKVHYPLSAIDIDGNYLGKMIPEGDLSEGDLLETMINKGPESYASSPTTGNAWARNFLEKVLPIPEKDYVTCPDSYLTLLAPMYGTIKRISEPQAFYRIHGENNINTITYEEQLSMYNRECILLRDRLQDIGITSDPDIWMNQPKTAGLQKILHAVGDIAAVISPEQSFILADENQWGPGKAGNFRRCIPFTEHKGQYWGLPADDASAIIEIERQRESGAAYIVFAWPAFWLLDYYSGMHNYLQSHYKCLKRNDHIIIFQWKENEKNKTN